MPLSLAWAGTGLCPLLRSQQQGRQRKCLRSTCGGRWNHGCGQIQSKGRNQTQQFGDGSLTKWRNLKWGWHRVLQPGEAGGRGRSGEMRKDEETQLTLSLCLPHCEALRQVPEAESRQLANSILALVWSRLDYLLKWLPGTGGLVQRRTCWWQHG